MIMMRNKAGMAAIALAVLGLGTAKPSLAEPGRQNENALHRIRHFVVIYQENHSFDNLYGGWEKVNGRSKAPLSLTQQVSQNGGIYQSLLQNDVNLAQAGTFANAPFQIDSFIKPTDTTCPSPDVYAANGVLKGQGLPGGCTEDIVHRFYQEQYQLNGGKMNRYVTGSDAIGLTMGYYDTQQLPIYQYLHQPGHPRYAIADNFFQAAFGGSFLNHQWLIAARTPVFANAAQDGSSSDLHSIVDSNGMPVKYPLYTPTSPVKDAQLTVKCPSPVAGLACGDYAINTIQSTYQPFAPGTPDAKKLPPLTQPTIGDRLSDAHISWAWYSGGWANANGDIGRLGWTNGNGPTCADPNTAKGAIFPNCPNTLFQYHHQAFNYYANYAPGTEGRRRHLRDEQGFLKLANESAKECKLRTVSFIKPLGAENEHPGYASESNGNNHLVDLIQAVENSACAKDTMIMITYDEFGGQWDHVAPPGQGNNNGPHDQWGPGTRIPAMVISPLLPKDFVVDHTPHDTTSIIATIERRFGLKPLSSRDAHVNDMFTVFAGDRDRDDHDRR